MTVSLNLYIMHGHILLEHLNGLEALSLRKSRKTSQRLIDLFKNNPAMAAKRILIIDDELQCINCYAKKEI